MQAQCLNNFGLEGGVRPVFPEEVGPRYLRKELI